MKKIALILLLIISIQNLKAQIKVGPKLIVNFPAFRVSEKGEEDSYSALLKISGGLMLDYEVNDFFSVRPELMFLTKGSDFKVQSLDGATLTSLKGDIMINYLQMPVNGVFKLKISQTDHLFFSSGPYVAYAVGGRQKVEGLGKNKINFSNSYDENSSDPQIKRFDFGFNFGVGVSSYNIFISVNYDLGIKNIVPTASDDNTKTFNRVGFINFGYLF